MEVYEMEGGEEEGIWSGTLDLNSLPQDCIATIFSFTSPRDACRLSLVSTMFKSASESDVVWESFLPSDYQAIIPSSLGFSSKKELYLSLCENPVLIDGGRKSISLERESGKKCYMLSARDLYIAWSDTPTYWRWISLPESRFEEVAELITVCWAEIRGKISISILSPMTHYKAYLVFKATSGAYGFGPQPVEVSMGVIGTECSKRTAYLPANKGRMSRYPSPFLQLPRASDAKYAMGRVDGWMELELGEFFNQGCTDGELEISVLKVKTLRWKRLVIQGIEIRPNP